MTTRRQLLLMSAASAIAGSALTASAQKSTPRAQARSSIRQIRNATLRIDYGGVRFLVDPMLADRHSFPGFPGTVNSDQRNPMVHLPLPVGDIVDVDAVIVTHLHEDHWDEKARASLPKDIPVFAQNTSDADTIRGQGFRNVDVLTNRTEFKGVRLTKTSGRHGTEAHYEVMADILGQACGVVFRHPAEKTVYLAGDTIWNGEVETALSSYAPDIVILNTGYAMIEGMSGGIIMGTEDVLKVHNAAPQTPLIATHMEAVNHCVLTRAELREFAAGHGFDRMLQTPGDGETIFI